MKQSETHVLDDVIATLKSQNRDIRSVSLEEAKELTFQILVSRKKSGTPKYVQCSAAPDDVNRAEVAVVRSFARA